MTTGRINQVRNVVNCYHAGNILHIKTIDKLPWALNFTYNTTHILHATQSKTKRFIQRHIQPWHSNSPVKGH